MYIIVAIIVIIVIVFAVILSSNTLVQAYIDDSYLDDLWFEDVNERFYEERSFGLEKQASFTYYLNEEACNGFPAFLTVTTFKTLFMISEDDLFENLIETIHDYASVDKVILNESSKLFGDRTIKNGNHPTRYCFFEGSINISGLSERVFYFGEIWNCGVSGSSIVCIGFAQVTNNSIENFSHLGKMVRDNYGTFKNEFNFPDYLFEGNDGLIYNIKCH